MEKKEETKKEYKSFVDYSDLLNLMEEHGINGYTVRPGKKFSDLPVSQKTILNMKDNGNVEIRTLLALAEEIGIEEIHLTMTKKGFKVSCEKSEGI